MPNDFITRTGAEALIPEETTKTIIQGAIAQSVVLSRGKKLPNMSSKTESMPVLAMLPEAYFVEGDTGLAQTTKQMWDKKRLVAEQLNVIVPIPNTVLDDMQDSGYDFEGEVLPRIYEAIGKTIDAAIIWGVNKPANWRTSLADTIHNSGNSVAETGDLYQDIMGKGGLFSKVEANGFECNAIIAPVTFKADLRGLTDKNGRPIFTKDLQTGNTYALDGNPCNFVVNGSWDSEKASAIAGDFNQLVYAFRKDMTAKLLTEAVITDNNKNIIYNLAQQNMVALMVTCRLGWELPNPINALNPDNASRLPFAMLTPATITSGHKVTVTVKNEDGTATVSEAEVDLAGSLDITNESGVVEYTNLPDGTYIVVVKADGYKTKRAKIVVDGADKTAEIKLVAAD
jgi:HK97 family phage major capsid protein